MLSICSICMDYKLSRLYSVLRSVETLNVWAFSCVSLFHSFLRYFRGKKFLLTPTTKMSILCDSENSKVGN